MSSQTENDLDSFIQTFRRQRGDTPTSTATRTQSLNFPLSHFTSQSENDFYRKPAQERTDNTQVVRSLSPEDVRKLKYKIDLDKQVAEKQKRYAREWEQKLQRDRKYVQHQPFGRHERPTIIKKEELEEILTKGRHPSPDFKMSQQHPPLHQQQQQQPPMIESYTISDNNTSNMFNTPRQPTFNNYPQYPNYQPSPPQPSNNTPNTTNTNINNNNKHDFQRFYGPTSDSNQPKSIATAQPIKGDAHDPFLLFDPNKEGQNVFNIIPQQDLYDPWGRPGGGAPLIHAPTGQRFTRYSGSLQDKLNHVGPLGFYGRQYSGNIEEQKRELELEQRRRQQEEMEHRANAGDTAEWITQLERSRFPLRKHLPTTETTREYAGARARFPSEETRVLHDDLVRQAEERSRLQKADRYHSSVAELQHSEAMNSWWGRKGGGAPSFSRRRQNVSNSLEQPRQKWTTNHLGQLVMSDEEFQGPVRVQADNYYSQNRQLSNHRNYYEIIEDQPT